MYYYCVLRGGYGMKSNTKERLRRQTTRTRRQKDPSKQSKTKLKKKEEALSLSQDRLRALVETTSDWIWEIDAQGTYTYVSPKVTELLGFSVKEVLGKTPFDLMPPEEADRIALIVQPLFANAQPIRNLENINVHKDGHLVILETSGVPILDTSGKVVGYRGIDRDITERKQMEKELRESEARFRRLADNAHDIIYRMSLPDGAYEYISPSIFDISGYTPEEHHNGAFTLNTIIHPDSQEFMNQQWENLRHGNDIAPAYEFKIMHKNGTERWLHQTNVLVQDKVGAFIALEAIATDITERKLLEEALRQSEHRFRSLSEASLEAIVFIEDGVIVDANKALNRLFGYEGEDLRGKLATDFIVPEKRPFTDERMRTRIVGAYETFGLRKDGSTFPIEVNAREYEHDGKKLRISAVRDLTEYKKIEKQLKDYQEHLERLVEERTSELKESEQKYRDIFENAVVGIYQSTPEGRFLRANPALARLYGYESPEELIASITDIGIEIYTDPERRQDFMDLAESEGITRDFEAQVQTRDGSTKYMTMNARAVKDEHGKTLYFENMVQDITEKKKTEEALEAERHNLKEANTALMEANAALKVLLKHRDEDRKDLEERFLSNVQQLVMPHVKKMKKGTLDQVQRMSLGFIESNLTELVSPFLKSIQGFNFTPRQLEVVTLIREGRSTKDIAQILNMNERAVEKQRLLIRKKLGLNKDKTNLQAYLKSLS